jgi:hypothetical protein
MCVSAARATPIGALGLLWSDRTAAKLGALCVFSMGAANGALTLLPFFLPMVFGEHWHTTQTGIIMSINFGSSAFGLAVALPAISRFLNAKGVIMLANCWQTLAWLAFALVWDPAVTYVIVGCFLLNGIWWPCFRSTITSIFGAAKYGQALSAVGTVQQLTSTMCVPARPLPRLPPGIQRVRERVPCTGAGKDHGIVHDEN